MKVTSFVYFIVFGLSLFVLTGCLEQQSKVPYVVCSTNIIQDMVEQIAGDKVKSRVLINRSKHPKTFKPTARQIKTLQRASLVFYIGLTYEPALDMLFEKAGKPLKAIAVTKYIPKKDLIIDNQPSQEINPYVWLDITLWISAIEVVTNALCQQFPEHKVLFKQNQYRYMGELSTLNRWVDDQMSAIQSVNPVIVTHSNAFAYFATLYSLNAFDLAEYIALLDQGTPFPFNGQVVANVFPSMYVKMQKDVKHTLNDNNVVLMPAVYTNHLAKKQTYVDMVRYNVQQFVDTF